MNFPEYQEFAKKTAVYPKTLEGGLFYAALGLGGEVGELQNKIKKIARDKNAISKDDIKGELGDILWYVSQLCTEFGLSMEDVASYNIEKLKSRQQRGALTGSGDNR